MIRGLNFILIGIVTVLSSRKRAFKLCVKFKVQAQLASMLLTKDAKALSREVQMTVFKALDFRLMGIIHVLFLLILKKTGDLSVA